MKMDEVRSKYGSNHQKNYKTGMAGKIALLVIVFVVIGIVITGMAAYLGVSKVLTTARHPVKRGIRSYG
jgi:type VI protein secretion system component VasF